MVRGSKMSHSLSTTGAQYSCPFSTDLKDTPWSLSLQRLRSGKRERQLRTPVRAGVKILTLSRVTGLLLIPTVAKAQGTTTKIKLESKFLPWAVLGLGDQGDTQIHHTSFSIPPHSTLKKLDRLWIYPFSPDKTHLQFYNVLKPRGTRKINHVNFATRYKLEWLYLLSHLV